MTHLQTIVTHFWFDHQAEEAATLYTSIFPRSKLGRITRYSDVGQEQHHMKPGTVMTVDFELDGQSFVALNGGPLFPFNEAVSLMVMCDTQQEIDHYWSKLGKGGDEKAQQCGWLKDRFGVSWQVTPRVLSEMIADADSEKARRAMAAMMKMKKLDIAALQRAYDGAPGAVEHEDATFRG